MTHPQPRPAPTPALLCLAGVLALAVAMGIGRFAFTPLLPLMLRDGLIDAAGGAEMAAANYVGYLLGALSAARLAHAPLRLLRAALAGVAVLTALSAWAVQAPLAWAVRGLAGMCSAWVLVAVSTWCLRELTAAGFSRLGAWIYAGVGTGIAVAGLLTWLGGLQSSTTLWLQLAALAAGGTAGVAWLLRGQRDLAATTGAAATAPPQGRGHGLVVLCYGSFGFGYIVPTTFLPAMARQQIDDPLVFGLAWPLFGLAAAVSVTVAARWLATWPRRRLWAWAQALMAVGAVLPLAGRSPLLLALAAILVGGTFMVATMAGLQWVRELQPQAPAALLSRMTAAFATGQIAGPLVVRAAGPWQPLGLDALQLGSALAALLLAVTSAWLAWGAPPGSSPATLSAPPGPGG